MFANEVGDHARWLDRRVAARRAVRSAAARGVAAVRGRAGRVPGGLGGPVLAGAAA